MKKAVCRYVGWFIGIIALFTLLVTLAYAIPEDAIAWHREFSEAVLEADERSAYLGNLFGDRGEAHMLDVYTEKEMMKSSCYERADMNPFQAAMSNNNYSRYWHGYQVLLRPMLVFYQIWQIRYINQFVFFGLLMLVLLETKKRLGGGYAAALFMTLGCCGLTSVPSCLNYLTVFLIMMGVSLAVLCRYPFQKAESFGLLMMVTGMVTSFADLLTTPMLTLGVPLALYVALGAKNEKPVRLSEMIGVSAVWGGGYAACWGCKWLIGSAAVGWKNMFGAVGERSELWAGGLTAAERLDAIIVNLRQLLLAEGIRTMIFPLALLVILLALAIRCLDRSQIGTAGKMLLIAAMPFAWYFVMAAHSIEHSRFTFRTGSLLLIGVYFALAALVDWKRVRAAICAKR